MNIVKEFKGGSMAKTYLIEKNGKNIVRKIIDRVNDDGLGMEKLKAQFDWIARFNNNQPSTIFPSVKFFVIAEKYAYYDMEFVNMATFRDVVLKNPHNPEIVHLIEDYIRFGALIALQEVEQTDEDFESYIYEKHIKKMLKRCKVIKDDLIYKSEYITINGKKLKNLEKLIDEIMINRKLLNFLQPEKFHMSHGDFTLQNILTDGRDVKVIDPRGEGSDSIYYDIGKIFQSCHGKYDLMFDGNYDISVKEENGSLNIDYKIKKYVEEFEDIYNEISDSIPYYYNISNPRWKVIAKFYEASHFISMTPFRLKENGDITALCYVKGIEILNEVLEEWDNV